MTSDLKPAAKPKSRSYLLAYLIAITLLVAYADNPVDRVLEVGPRTYQVLGAVVVASQSTGLRQMLKDALDEDGKLTQHRMAKVWPMYEKALPVGFVLPPASSANRESERQQLIASVGAQPKRIVWTL